MKKFITGFLCCFILMTGVSFAANYNAIQAGFKIFVNGTQFQPVNPPVVIDGRTYLPLRSMGDVLGVKVNWNDSKKQVEIGEPPVDPTPTKAVSVTPTPATLEKNTFITKELQKLKITILGQIPCNANDIYGPDNKDTFEVWQFKIENVSIYKAEFTGSFISCNFGAENKGFTGMFLLKNKEYSPIGRGILDPGESVTGIIGYKVSSQVDKRHFDYNWAGTFYEEE